MSTMRFPKGLLDEDFSVFYFAKRAASERFQVYVQDPKALERSFLGVGATIADAAKQARKKREEAKR